MLAMLMQPETAGVHRSAARKKEKGEAEANAKVGGGGGGGRKEKYRQTLRESRI